MVIELTSDLPNADRCVEAIDAILLRQCDLLNLRCRKRVEEPICKGRIEKRTDSFQEIAEAA